MTSIRELLEAHDAEDATREELLTATMQKLGQVTAERDQARQDLADLQAWVDEHMRTEHPEDPDEPEDPTAALKAAWGVCTHPNFAAKPAWEDPDRWMAHAADVGFTQIRGLFVTGGSQAAANCRRVLELCRQYGIRWLMTLVPEDWSVTASGARAKIQWLADQGWHDVVLGFEGPNEPDHERGGGEPPADWPQRTINRMQAIKAARDEYFTGDLWVPVLSSALHDLNQDRLNGDGYRKLAALGIAELVDAVSLHSYPKGKTVLTGLGPRLELVDLAYPGKPVWITETGWTTYTKTGTGGHAATTEADAATYGAEAPAIIAAHPRVEKAFRYELEDDPGDGTDSETRFGLFRPNGNPKPEATALRNVFAGG